MTQQNGSNALKQKVDALQALNEARLDLRIKEAQRRRSDALAELQHASAHQTVLYHTTPNSPSPDSQ